MKNNTDIDNLFKELKGSFDTQEPSTTHTANFIEKLNATKKTPKKFSWKLFAIAASIAFLCSIGFTLFYQKQTTNEQIAEIAPEVNETKFYFASLINTQVNELKKETSPSTKKIIDDTLIQLNKLESDYKKLEKNLLNGGNTKLILSAIITNYQTRIDLIRDVMAQIDTIKNLKKYNDENSTL
ncbi:MAG: hypothetical protein ABJD66_10085 [Cellulophaga sp.]|uniref:hypothetical protein n=1 Tax=Cellulophaga sp. TaxID=1972202 RepID=UPI003266AD86